MKHTYVPVMLSDKRVGSAYIDANRLVVIVSDAQIKSLIWDDKLLTNVNIYIPGATQVLTIHPNKESEGNNNG